MSLFLQPNSEKNVMQVFLEVTNVDFQRCDWRRLCVNIVTLESFLNGMNVYNDSHAKNNSAAVLFPLTIAWMPTYVFKGLLHITLCHDLESKPLATGHQFL